MHLVSEIELRSNNKWIMDIGNRSPANFSVKIRVVFMQTNAIVFTVFTYGFTTEMIRKYFREIGCSVKSRL